MVLREPGRHHGCGGALQRQGGQVIANKLPTLKKRYREPDHIGRQSIESLHQTSIGSAPQATGRVLHGGQRLCVSRVRRPVAFPALRSGNLTTTRLPREPTMRQHDTALAPQQSTLHLRLVALAGAQHTLACQEQQIIFETAKVKLHALLKPLCVGCARSRLLVGFKSVEVQDQRHHRSQQQ